MDPMRPFRDDYETPRQKRKRTTSQEFIRGCVRIIIALIAGSAAITLFLSITVNVLPSPNGPAGEKVTIVAFLIQSVVNSFQPPNPATVTPDFSSTTIAQTTTAIGITQTAMEQTLQAKTNTFTPTLSNTPSPIFTNTLSPSFTPTLPQKSTNTSAATRAVASTATFRPVSTPTPRPTPLGLNDALHIGNLVIELIDYRYSARDSTDEAAIWLNVRFTNEGNKDTEIRFSESELQGLTDDGESYTEYTTSFRGYVEAPSNTCIYIGSWNFPDPNVTLFLPASSSQTYEFYLHRDGVDPEERCPESSAEYVSRVSIGTNWVDTSLPLDIQSEGERTTSFTVTWRLVRP